MQIGRSAHRWLSMIKKYKVALTEIEDADAEKAEERGNIKAYARRIFSEIDADGDGQLSRGEMEGALKHMGKEPSQVSRCGL